MLKSLYHLPVFLYNIPVQTIPFHTGSNQSGERPRKRRETMKKLLALLLALCLLCAFALAEEDEDSGPLELNWEDVVREDIEAAGTAEQITVAGVTLLYWIPGDMPPADVSGSRAEIPPAAVYSTEDGEYAISLFSLNVTSPEEYLSGLEAAGVEYFENLRLNGLDCVGCENQDENVQILIVPIDGTTLLEFRFTPFIGEAGWIEIKDLVAASVRPAV